MARRYAREAVVAEQSGDQRLARLSREIAETARQLSLPVRKRRAPQPRIEPEHVSVDDGRVTVLGWLVWPDESERRVKLVGDLDGDETTADNGKPPDAGQGG